jgi:protein-S-isoprenylcysteine O-methyltransferase Ste14
VSVRRGLTLVQEILFKITLAALLLVDASIRLYYQRGRAKFEKIVIKHEWREKFFYALVSLGLVSILIYVLTPWLDPFHIPIHSSLRWLGAGIILAGDLLFIWSHRALGKNWSPFLEIRKGHTLVTDGPYRYIRHPMYASIFLIGIGVSLLSANGIVALAYLMPVTSMYLVRVSDEEEMMVEQFGDEYRDYMRRTGRLVPKLGVLKR